MQEFVLSDDFKALVSNYFKDKSEENLIKVFTEFGCCLNRYNLELITKELEIKQCVEAMNKAEQDGEIIKLLREEEKWEDDITKEAKEIAELKMKLADKKRWQKALDEASKDE